MTDRELMQMALDALDEYYVTTPEGKQLVEALRARLAQPEPPCKTGSQCVGGKCERCVEPEPVAWRGANWSGDGNDYCYRDYDDPPVNVRGENVGEPLYTAPPQRKEWVGLTDSDRAKLFDLYGYKPVDIVSLCNAIEAKLKEKNT